MGKHLLAKVHMAMLNDLTELEVTESTSSKVDETALAILKRQGSRGIKIVRSPKKFTFDSEIMSIVTELIHKTLHTDSEGLSNCGISPSHLESLPPVRNCLRSYSMERNTKSRARIVI